MFSPSYGNFWHTGYVVINPGDPLPLNNTSTAVTGGISRSGNVINIPQAGDYLISYSVTIFPENRVAVAGIYLNDSLVPNAQTRSQL
ncbi:hypothetical protein [Bacillus sp. OV322]|uniref:hypothetical protein n=1 Tax=Bacillus sp. OV322 TaxID=1882764 RepID=UPI000B8A1AD9|nr:hypothetical protein [Bacillus sp. OV322]